MNDWYYVNWAVDYPDICHKHITFLELKAILVAANRWGRYWRGLHVHVRSDNMASVSAVNKATSRSHELMVLIRELFWLSVLHDFKLTASHIPGKLNILADYISRLEAPVTAVQAWETLQVLNPGNNFCKDHMSYGAFSFLQMSWMTHSKIF